MWTWTARHRERPTLVLLSVASAAAQLALAAEPGRVAVLALAVIAGLLVSVGLEWLLLTAAALAAVAILVSRRVLGP